VNAYFDSGIIIKTYCLETDSPSATALLKAEQIPLPLTRFQETETRNALRLKLFRREITPEALDESLQAFTGDIQNGLFQIVPIDETALHRRSESLSRLHTATVGTRTLDVLHVAAALEIGATRFISLDARQRAMAKKAGLTVLPKP